MLAEAAAQAVAAAEAAMAAAVAALQIDLLPSLHAFATTPAAGVGDDWPLHQPPLPHCAASAELWGSAAGQLAQAHCCCLAEGC